MRQRVYQRFYSLSSSCRIKWKKKSFWCFSRVFPSSAPPQSDFPPHLPCITSFITSFPSPECSSLHLHLIPSSINFVLVLFSVVVVCSLPQFLLRLNMKFWFGSCLCSTCFPLTNLRSHQKINRREKKKKKSSDTCICFQILDFPLIDFLWNIDHLFVSLLENSETLKHDEKTK